MKIVLTKENIVDFCDKLMEWSIYTLIVTTAFSISLVEIASTTLIVCWLVKVAVKRDLSFFKQVPVKILAVFFLWTILSCINTEYPKESFRGVMKVAEYSAVFLAVAGLSYRERFVKRLLWVTVISSFIFCLNGFFQHITGEGLIRHRKLTNMDYLRRISSSFVHPNDFGAYLMVMSVVAISIVISKAVGLRERIACSILSFTALWSLFLTHSRGAWISFCAALIVLGAIKARKVMLLFILFLVLIFFFLPQHVQERLYNVTDLQSGTSWERVMLWKGATNMIKVHPVLGFGPNTYSRNFPKYKPAEYPDCRYAHNSYLQFASEIGIVGMLLLIMFILATLYYASRGIKWMPDGQRRALTSGLFAGMVGFSLNCLVDTHLQSVTLSIFFYMFLGLCFALSQQTNEK
jgi:putative inorganic carbon (HCO3(-)) transporter